MIPRKPNRNQMKPIQVYIEKDDHKALKEANADISAIVRRAIKISIKELKK